MLVLVKGDEYFRFVEVLTASRSGDRRRSPRIPARVHVQFQFDSRIPEVISRNVSRHGISVFTTQRFSVGDLVSMKLTMPGVLDEVVVVGRVVIVRVDGESIEQPAKLKRMGETEEDHETRRFAAALAGKAAEAKREEAAPGRYELGVEFVRLLPDARTQYKAFLKRLGERNQPVKIFEDDGRQGHDASCPCGDRPQGRRERRPCTGRGTSRLRIKPGVTAGERSRPVGLAGAASSAPTARDSWTRTRRGWGRSS